jgi:two-component system chemotaxis sensor kinase CheA
MDPRLARRVVLANSIALTLGAVTLPYAVIFWLMGARALAVAVVPIALVYVVTPFVAARVSFGAARAVMFTTFPLAVFAYASSFGERAGIQLLLFAAVCMPVLLCELRERAALAHGLGMSVAAFLVLELSEYSLLGAPVVGPWVQQIVRLAIVATTFVFLLTAVFYFALSSRRAEASLDGRNRAMRLVLDHVEQGLVTVEADGRLLPERSAAADRWLGVPAPGESLVELTRAHDPGYADWLALGLATLAEDALPVEVVLDQLPARLAAGGRVLEPSYKPIDGSNGRLLVMFTDVTARLERERAEEQQAEVVALVTRALADRGVVRACLAEARELIDRLVSGASAAAGADAVARDLHTLKGNAALFGLGSVARLCHGVEDACAETRAPPDDAALGAVAARFAEVTAPVLPLLGEGGGPEVSHDDVVRLRALVSAGADAREVLAEISAWSYERADRRLALLAEQARGLAARLGRDELSAEVAARGVRVDPARWAPLWSALAHVVRNAVDHGIESPDERLAAGKSASGSLTLEARAERDDVVLEVRDDGRGVDWGRVAARARAHGLPHETHAELVDALFCDGLSTRDAVTETSGRGVGLAALRSTCDAIGARVDVQGGPGRGTTFVLRVPHAAKRPSLRPPASAAA